MSLCVASFYQSHMADAPAGRSQLRTLTPGSARLSYPGPLREWKEQALFSFISHLPELWRTSQGGRTLHRETLARLTTPPTRQLSHPLLQTSLASIKS